MPVYKLELELPFDFHPDPILQAATPEQRAIVLTTGCVALKALLNKMNSLSYEEAYENATAEEAAKWLAEKIELEKKAEREKKEIQDKNLTEVRRLEHELESLQKEFKRKEVELTKANTLRATAEKKAETLLESQDRNSLDERIRTRTQVESEKSHEIEKLNNEINENKTKIENIAKALEEAKRNATDAAIQAEKDKSDAIEKVREQLNTKIEQQQERILSLTSRYSNSSLKGKDNEEEFAQLLHSTFGLSPDYMKQEHRIESGDHIIQWEGLKLMFENKIIAKRVSPEEVDKAVRDFKKHPECDVLIFVSEYSSIANHERPGHLDIDTVDGRPAIWIGEFNFNQNKVVYLQMIAQVIRQLARLQKRAKALGNDDDVIDDYRNKITAIRRHFQNTKDDLDRLVKAQNNYQRAQKLAWDTLKDQVTAFKNNFSRRLESAMKDDDEEIEEKDESETRTNDKISNSILTQQQQFDYKGRNGANEADDSEPATKKTESKQYKIKGKKSTSNSKGSQKSIEVSNA